MRWIASLGSRARPPACPTGEGDRRFTSSAVEALIPASSDASPTPRLPTIFENCFPNTLDTTVFAGDFEGKPDTYVVTGDIDAMWLRDSSAQVWPYLPLAKEDDPLRELLGRRDSPPGPHDPRWTLMPMPSCATKRQPPLSWAVNDKTEHHAGVGERKWEIDSLCYPIRLAHGYWQATGDTQPFDAPVERSRLDHRPHLSRAAAQAGPRPVLISARVARSPVIRCRWADSAIQRCRSA